MQSNSNTYEIGDYLKYPFALPNNFSTNQSRSVDENNNESRKNLNLEEAILEIKKSITGEKDDETFYAILLSQAPNEEDKRIIQSIINDERKHNKMFKTLYSELTQKPIPRKYNVKK